MVSRQHRAMVSTRQHRAMVSTPNEQHTESKKSILEQRMKEKHRIGKAVSQRREKARSKSRVLRFLERRKATLPVDKYTDLKRAVEEEIVEAEVMQAIYRMWPARVPPFPEPLAKFVLFMYCATLLSSTSEAAACISSSGGSLTLEEVVSLVKAADGVEHGETIDERVYKTLAKITATTYFCDEDVERSSLVLEVARRDESLRALYPMLLKTYRRVLYMCRPYNEARQSLPECLIIPDPRCLLQLGSFARSLVFERRPNCLLPHAFAVAECTMHAFLLLKRSEINVTYPVPVSYAGLWKLSDVDARHELCVYYESRYCSVRDLHLRSNAANCHSFDRTHEVKYVTVSDIEDSIMEMITPSEIRIMGMMKSAVIADLNDPRDDIQSQKVSKAGVQAAVLRHNIRTGIYLLEPPEYHKYYEAAPVPPCGILANDEGEYVIEMYDSSDESDDAEVRPKKTRR